MSFEKRLKKAQARLNAMKKAVPKKIGNYILANYKDPKGNKLDGPDSFKKYYNVVAKFNKGDKKSDKLDNDKNDDVSTHPKVVGDKKLN